MSYRTIHLTLSTHPSPISESAIEYACRATLRFSAKLNVTSPHLKVRAPSHSFASGMMDSMASEFERNAAAKSAELERCVYDKGTGIGLDVDILQLPAHWPSGASDMTWRGRTSDLCILGLPQTGIEGRQDVEDWIFGVGRPCLLCPNEYKNEFDLNTVLVSWDYSKFSARAICDALPVLKAAQKVIVLTIRGEKNISPEDVKPPVLALLAKHDVKADFVEAELGAKSIGHTILDQAHSAHADLLVMGAYGHSRLREFVLGGATREILSSTRIPLFVSH